MRLCDDLGGFRFRDTHIIQGVVFSQLASRVLPRPFPSFGSLSRYENSHERRRHERRSAERGHYTRPHYQGPAVRHTVSRPPFSPRRSVLTIDLTLSRTHCYQRSALRSSLYM